MASIVVVVCVKDRMGGCSVGLLLEGHGDAWLGWRTCCSTWVVC